MDEHDQDHHGHHAHMAADYRKRFWISLVLTLPILVLSPLLQKLVGLREAISFSGDTYVLFGFASAVFWYGGWRALRMGRGDYTRRGAALMSTSTVIVAINARMLKINTGSTVKT